MKFIFTFKLLVEVHIHISTILFHIHIKIIFPRSQIVNELLGERRRRLAVQLPERYGFSTADILSSVACLLARVADATPKVTGSAKVDGAKGGAREGRVDWRALLGGEGSGALWARFLKFMERKGQVLFSHVRFWDNVSLSKTDCFGGTWLCRRRATLADLSVFFLACS